MDIFVQKSRELMRKNGVKISGDAVENMVRSYASHVVSMENNAEENPDDYWEDEECPEWMYDDGYKTAMERWLNLIGINEKSPYVQSFIDEEKEKRGKQMSKVYYLMCSDENFYVVCFAKDEGSAVRKANKRYEDITGDKFISTWYVEEFNRDTYDGVLAFY